MEKLIAIEFQQEQIREKHKKQENKILHYSDLIVKKYFKNIQGYTVSCEIDWK